MLQDVMTKFGVHASFVSAPTLGGNADKMIFGINHYAGSCTYDVTNFIEKDTDILDAGFVTLLRNSADPFVTKLLSGPSLATETHHQDSTIIVQAQVSSRPLRRPTALAATPTSPTTDEPSQLDPAKTYPITTQLNHNLSELFASLDRSHLWIVSCIRPNDSGSPNSFDKRRVKAQIRSLLLPDIIARRKTEFVVDFEQLEFCNRYVPTMLGETPLRIRQCAQKNGLRENTDYILGHRSIWLTYNAWKLVEDGVREQERESRKSRDGTYVDDDSLEADDAATEHTADPSIHAGGGYFGESNDNLLLSRTTSAGMNYLDPNNGGAGRYGTKMDPTPEYTEPEDGSAWGSEWDKRGAADRSPQVESLPKEAGGLVVNNAPNAVEEVPTSRSRRFWLWMVRLSTWWIPDFLLTSIGRMKRPDVRLAWREKVTIFLIIFWCCAFVIFYIVFFGLLLCPDLNKAWNIDEVGQHTGDNDYWVAIQGRVYDVSNFVFGDHSDITGDPSNSEAILDELAGSDMTYYFPPPLSLACSGVVSDDTLQLQYKNFSPVSTSAIHYSGAQQSAQSTKLDNSDWYTANFLPKINDFHKGPLVIAKKDLLAQAQDTNIAK